MNQSNKQGIVMVEMDIFALQVSLKRSRTPLDNMTFGESNVNEGISITEMDLNDGSSCSVRDARCL